jgi:hypothetical protein
MLSLTLVSVFSAIAAPALAQGRVAADADDDEEDEDDDILAPVRGEGDKPATAVTPAVEKSIQIGILGITPLGEAGKSKADTLTAELQKALNESPTVAFKPLALGGGDAAVVIDPAVAEGAKAEAEASLERSKNLLSKLQFGKAKASYEKTLSLLEKAAPALATPDLFIETWLGLAEIAARQAKDDMTSQGLSMVVSFNPEYELDQKRFPGLFVTTHRKVRDQMMDADKGTIIVDASAAGAKVVIDGREVAGAPAKATGLYPGPHLVRVLREGLPPYGQVITVAAGGTETISPGFLDPSRAGPGDDLAQNRFSADSAAAVAAAAAATGFKGAIVGVLSKSQSRLVAQLVYVDAASKGVAILPEVKLQADLLDVAIESLKARARIEELAGAAAPAVAEADGSEVLIEGANAGTGITMAEVTMRFEVRKTGNLAVASRDVRDDDDDEDGGERAIANSNSGSRRRLDDKSDRLGRDRSADNGGVDEDAPFTEQPWFLPTVITAGVVGVAALAAGTTVGLIAFKVIPDPRPANGAQVSVTLPTAASAAAP